MLTLPLLELLTKEKNQALQKEARTQHLLWEAKRGRLSYWQHSKTTLGTMLMRAGQHLKAEQATPS